MKFHHMRFVVPAIATALLAACGGGSDIDADDLVPTARPASVAVSNAATTSLNGTYSTTNISLTEVTKFNPIGAPAETCRFRFAGLQGPGGTMDGDIRYRPGTFIIETMFISIAGVEFSIAEGSNTSVDRPNNEIDLLGKVFNPDNPLRRLTVTGSIPMPLLRPEGC